MARMALRTDLVRRLTARAEGAGTDAEADTSLAESSEGRVRREAVQRLQLGVGGIATMFLLVGLANAIDRRADMAEAVTVPEAVATPSTESSPVEDDPLVSAGVVPDLQTDAASSTPAPGTSGAGNPRP